MTDKARYPLPRGIEDAVVNRAQLAEALAVSEPTIDRYRKDGMPVLVEGTNGQAYQFQLSECWAWLKGKDDERRAQDERARHSIRQLRLEVVGGTVGDSEMGLTPKERQAIYDVELSYNKLARERGDLVPLAEVTELLDHVLSTIRSTLTGLPDRLSRDAALTGRQAEQAVVVTDDVIAELHRTLGAYVAQKRDDGHRTTTTREAAE
jgi:phage terminase Nu1 subunit (DNA packaging protein)